MKKKISLLILTILFPIFMSGCWDYEEYEDLAQVSAIGIDFNKESGESTITVQYIPTAKDGQKGGADSSNSSSKKKEIVHTATAKTLYEALPKVQQVIFKKLFYGYLRVIVIGEEAAKNNMMDIIELLDRTPAARNSAYVIITSGRAEDAVSTFDAARVGPSSEEEYNLINSAEDMGAAYPVTLQNFAEMLSIGGLEATAPRLIVVSNEAEPEAKGGSDDNIKYDEERKGDQRVSGIAAFKKDKFIGWLNEKESLGYGWIAGKKVRTYKTSGISYESNTEDMFYYRVDRTTSKIKVQLENNKPSFQVNVKVQANLRKYYSNKGSEFLTPMEVSDIEKKLSNSIHSDIEAALKKAQKELQSDIFGFGFALFRKNPKLWKTEYEGKWEDIFPNIPINIDVETKIINTGTNNRRLNLK